MTVEYACRIEDPFGRHIKTVRNFGDPPDGGGAGLDYILNVSKASSLLLTLPAVEDQSLFDVDCRFIPLRSFNGEPLSPDNDSCYLLRKKTITRNWFRMSAVHVTGLLDRRVVAYDSGSTYATKTDNAGDLIKKFARENIGSSVNTTDRDTTSMTTVDLVTPGYLEIEQDNAEGQSLTRESSRGKMLGILQDIADTSTQAGTYMSFGVVGSTTPFRLVTRDNSWGDDRRYGTRKAVILSPQKGNMSDWKLELDYSEEASVVIAGGDGQKDERIIQVATNTDRINASPFGHIEEFVDAPNCDTAAKVLAYANSVLRQKEVRISFEADLIETSGTIRGVDFDLGDIVTVMVNDPGVLLNVDCRIDTIYVSVRKSGIRSRINLVSPI